MWLFVQLVELWLILLALHVVVHLLGWIIEATLEAIDRAKSAWQDLKALLMDLIAIARQRAWHCVACEFGKLRAAREATEEIQKGRAKEKPAERYEIHVIQFGRRNNTPLWTFLSKRGDGMLEPLGEFFTDKAHVYWLIENIFPEGSVAKIVEHEHGDW